jgi:Domain of unknown function (DUF6438)
MRTAFKFRVLYLMQTMKKHIYVFLSIFLIVTCKSQSKNNSKTLENSLSTKSSGSAIIFTLEKTACYGTCPIFKVIVFDNDSLVFDGEEYVKKKGQYSKSLSKGTVAKLIKQFNEVNFFQYKDTYTENITDLPTTYISFSDGGKTKKIKDYVGSPESLKNLEKLIVNLVSEEIGEKH